MYIPDLPKPVYQDLLEAFDREFTYTPFVFEQNFEQVSRYTDELQAAAFEALEEAAILVAVLIVYHAK